MMRSLVITMLPSCKAISTRDTGREYDLKMNILFLIRSSYHFISSLMQGWQMQGRGFTTAQAILIFHSRIFNFPNHLWLHTGSFIIINDADIIFIKYKINTILFYPCGGCPVDIFLPE